MKNHHLMKRYTTTFIQVIQTEMHHPVQTGIIMHIFILQIPDSIIIPITIVIGGSLQRLKTSPDVTNVAGYNYIGEYQGHHYFSKESSSYYWYQAANTINSDFSQYGKDAYMYIPNSEVIQLC